MAKSRRKPRPAPGDKLNKLVAQGEFTDEELDEAIEELAAGLSADELMTASRIYASRSFSVTGFAAFYRLVHGNDLPKHARRWVEDIFQECGAEEKQYEGVVLWAWRGSWKSTTISVTLTAFYVGHNPELTNLIIGANDDSAEKLAAAVSRIIELHPAWQMVFPYVVPDKDKGWGAEGYSVWDNRMDKAAWTQRTSSTIDPTFLGAGYNSSRLIGKHPTGLLLIDDIHDEKNSISARERETVVRVVAETILPMAVRRKTWIVAIGTPWDEDDALHYLKNTGVFYHVAIPVMVRADEGEGVYVDGSLPDGISFGDIRGWWKLAWDEMFDAGRIVVERAKAGLRGFSRMFLLDLASGRQGGLKFYTYPADRIEVDRWELGAGVDFATVLESTRSEQTGRDKFSMAWGAKDPLGRIIVFDGILEQCTQAQAEDHMEKPQSVFGRRWRRTVLEGDGIGEQFFISLMRRNPGLRVIMQKTGGKAKHYRQERELGPWLENGRVLVSDGDTPYLNALRKALDDFPDGNNDIRDGLYWLLFVFPETLTMPRADEAVAQSRDRQKEKHPIYAVAGGIGR